MFGKTKRMRGNKYCLKEKERVGNQRGRKKTREQVDIENYCMGIGGN